VSREYISAHIGAKATFEYTVEDEHNIMYARDADEGMTRNGRRTSHTGLCFLPHPSPSLKLHHKQDPESVLAVGRRK
jgi:hypothetical protein